MAIPAERERELEELVARVCAGEDLKPDLGPPIVSRCGFCDFAVEAPLVEARRLFAEHDCPRR